ncbi:MAG: GntR family transcriptional regulator [Betaproteobacteria bacterium]|nr:GntR family transcriptional regulator [Betaproteobacteria bacterium]
MAAELTLPADDALQPGALVAGPLYVEVKKRVMRSLMDGEWLQSSPIPSEAQLAQRYAVSVGTVRKAIGELVAERVLVRQPGRGTFVASHNRDYMLEAFFHIVDERGHKEFPASRLLTFRHGRADELSARFLRLAKDRRVFQFENLLHLQGRPVIFDRIRVPQAVFPDFDEGVFRQRDMTIFGLYQARYGVTVTRLEEWIRAANADDRVARLLVIKDDAAVLRIDRVAYTFDGTPVEFRERFVDTRSHAYLNALGMKKS